MTWMPDAEFWRRHKQNALSNPFRAVKRQMILKSPRCAVCGLAYQRKYNKWQLQYDHKFYRAPSRDGELIFGHETAATGRLLCPDHHLQGTRTDAEIASLRRSYRADEATLWLYNLLTSLAWWLVCLPFRFAWKVIRRPRE